MKYLSKNKRSVLLVALIAFLFFVAFSYAAVKRHENYLSDFDLALATNTLWNTTHSTYGGSTMNLYFSGYEGNNYLGLHFSPVLFLALPFFVLWPRPETLLIFQSLILVLGVIPLYHIAKYFRINEKITIALMLYYLCFPGLVSAVLYDYHPITFLPLFFLSFFYFYLKKKHLPFVLFLILAVLVKENVSIFVSFFGLFLLFNKKDRKLGVALFVSGAVIFLILTGIIIPGLGTGSYPFQSFYPEMSQAPEKLTSISGFFDIAKSFVLRILSPPHKWFVVFIYLLLAFPAIFITKFSILLFAAPLLQKVLAVNQNYWEISHFHYNVAFLPVSIITIILGYVWLRKLVDGNKYRLLPTWAPRFSAITSLLLVLLSFLFINLPTLYSYSFYDNPSKPYYDELLENLPKESNNIAYSGFAKILPHLYNKNKVYLFPLIADAKHVVLLKDHERSFPEITNYLKRGGYYRVLFKNKEGSVFERKEKVNATLKNDLLMLCENNQIYDSAIVLQAKNCIYE